MDDNNITAQRIKETRKRKHLTLRQLAEMTGISRSSIQLYETGAIENMSISKLGKIAEALDVPADWLLGLENNESAIREEISLRLGNLSAEQLEQVLNFVRFVAQENQKKENQDK